MSFNRDSLAPGYSIQAYDLSTGSLELLHTTDPHASPRLEQYTRQTLVLSPHHLRSDWGPAFFSDLKLDELEHMLLELKDSHALIPSIVLIGIGPQEEQHSAHAEQVRHFFLQKGLGCEIMDLRSALSTYTLLSVDQRPVLALLFMQSAAG